MYCTVLESKRNSVRILEDEREEAVNQMASQLGLVCVGWIFTDLIAEDLTTGTVKHFRGNIVSQIMLCFFKQAEL